MADQVEALAPLVALVDAFSWARVVLALLSAVLLPLILHRIFYHKRKRHESSLGSGSLEDYMLKVPAEFFFFLLFGWRGQLTWLFGV